MDKAIAIFMGIGATIALSVHAIRFFREGDMGGILGSAFFMLVAMLAMLMTIGILMGY